MGGPIRDETDRTKQSMDGQAVHRYCKDIVRSTAEATHKTLHFMALYGEDTGWSVIYK